MDDDLQLLEAAADAGEMLRLEAAGEVTLDAAGDDLPRFTMLAYGGGLMLPAGFDQPVLVDLAELTIPEQTLPVHRDHKIGQVVGHTVEVTNDGRELSCAGVVSGGGEAAAEVVRAAAAGFPWRASVGCLIGGRRVIPAGSTEVVNGVQWVGPRIVVAPSTLREISFVSVGGDPAARAALAAAMTGDGREAGMFREWLAAQGFNVDGLTDAQRETLQASFDAAVSARLFSGCDAAQCLELERAIDAAGDDRVGTLERLAAAGGLGADNLADEPTGEAPDGVILAAWARELGCDVARLEAGAGGTGGTGGAPPRSVGGAIGRMRAERAREMERQHRVEELCAGHPQLALRAVADGWDTQRAELEVLRAERPRVGTGGGDAGGQGAASAAVLEASLLLAGGLPADAVLAAYGEEATNRTDDTEYQGAGLHMVMDHVLAAAGTRYRGSRNTEGFIRATLDAERQLQAAGSSTVSLSGILGNTANRAMEMSYNAQAVTWPMIAADRTHTNFKPHVRYRLEGEGAFRKVGADGELKNIGLGETPYTNQLETYGAIIALTRKMEIDDDLGAFLEMPVLVGQMGPIRIEEAVYVLWLSNPGNFHHTDNGNYFEGAGSALSIDSVDTAEAKFADAVNNSGKPVLVVPDRLLVPPGLKTTARTINTSAAIVTGGSSKVPRDNPHVGRYQTVSSPYLSNSRLRDQDGEAISGQSSTHWWMLADPKVRASIAVAFLNGRKVPYLERASATFNVLGMEWRSYFDFGVGMEDPNASVKSKGAA